MLSEDVLVFEEDVGNWLSTLFEDMELADKRRCDKQFRHPHLLRVFGKEPHINFLKAPIISPLDLRLNLFQQPLAAPELHQPHNLTQIPRNPNPMPPLLNIVDIIRKPVSQVLHFDPPYIPIRK